MHSPLFALGACLSILVPASLPADVAWFVSQSTKALLAPLRQLFLSLTTESNKTYWLVVRAALPSSRANHCHPSQRSHSTCTRIHRHPQWESSLPVHTLARADPTRLPPQATIVLPPIILGLAHYYQVSDADIADKVRPRPHGPLPRSPHCPLRSNSADRPFDTCTCERFPRALRCRFPSAPHTHRCGLSRLGDS